MMNNHLRLSENGLKHLKQEEGERLNAYKDVVGIWTIGVGHTGWVGKLPVKAGMKITTEQSSELLRQDVIRFEKAIKNGVKVPLNQNQFDALVGLVFNIGEGNFSRSTLLKKLNTGDYQGAAEQFLVWKRAGTLKDVLLPRRKREKALFEKEV